MHSFSRLVIPTVCLLFCAGTASRAQSSDLLAHEFVRKDVFDAMTKSMRDSRDYTKLMGAFKDVPGNGYFVPEWLSGTAVAASGTRVTSAAMRYNLAAQVLEMRLSPDDVKVYSTADINQFNFTGSYPDGHQFEVRTYQNSHESAGRAFFEVLNPGGALQFFLLHQIGVRPGSPPLTSTGETRADAFVKEVHLYVLRPNENKLSEFMISPKKVVKLFGDRARDVQEYAASNHLDYAVVQDIVAMADYYNKLVAKGQ